MSAPTAPAPPSREGKGLAAGTLGLWGSTVIGLASTAPVYSLALGVVLMVVWSFFADSKPFFRGESLNRSTAVLVPDEDELPTYRSIDGGV